MRGGTGLWVNLAGGPDGVALSSPACACCDGNDFSFSAPSHLLQHSGCLLGCMHAMQHPQAAARVSRQQQQRLQHAGAFCPVRAPCCCG